MKPPNVKKHLLDVLKAASIEAVSLREDAKSSKFVLVTSSGGPGRSNRIVQTVQVTLGMYALTPGLAADLATGVEELIYSLPAEATSPVAAVPWASTPYESPDPDRPNLARLVGTYQLNVICR